MPHLRKLEADLDQLATAFNHNAKIYEHSFTVSEMRTRVLERVVNDMLIGEVRTVQMERTHWEEEWKPGPDGTVKMQDTPIKQMVQAVDWTYYVTYFAVCMMFTEFTLWLSKLAAAQEQEKPAQRSIIVQPDEGDVQVFGG